MNRNLSIVGLDNNSFANKMKKLNQADYFEDLLYQCYRNAEIATHLFWGVRRSIILQYLSTPLWLCNIFLLYQLKL